jgi:predicted nucleic-acid-binding protein
LEAEDSPVIALDTNVVVRIITRDDERQAQQARRLLAAAQVYLSTSVLIECEWVLRSSYRYAADQVATALLSMCRLPNVTLERPELIRRALQAQVEGSDFADAVHLLTADADGASEFATFDKSLRKRADKITSGLKAISP